MPHSLSIAEAFRLTPRQNFLPDTERENAKNDEPLFIGFGQTNSQPSTVRMMLEWLEVEPGDKILDVGSGSGWTTALLSRLTGEGGEVHATEIIPELKIFGKENNERLGIKNVYFHQAGSILGWPKDAPYDRILVSARAEQFPEELNNQLSVNGKIVIPVRNSVLEMTKLPNNQFETIEHAGFLFVPLV